MRPTKTQRAVVFASIINPLTSNKCEFFPRGVMLIEDHKIKKILHHHQFINSRLAMQWKDVTVIDHMDQLILPSFFDMHFHWVQDDVRLKGKESLLTWLKMYAWPNEAKFKERAFSKEMAKKFFAHLPSVGTLGGAIFSSLHGHALEDAFRYAQGDFIAGNVLMTFNSPDYLSQSSQNALKLVEKMSAKYGERYAMTPRFALATDPTTMKAAAKIVKPHKSFIQSHLSETKEEIKVVLDIYRKGFAGFKDVENYTEIYRRCHNLGPRTLMAHGIYLSPAELRVLAQTKTAIIHCPTSNAPYTANGLGSGLFDFRKCEAAGVRWAFGSDIGGGPYLSLFDVMQSYVWQNQRKKIKGATYSKALYHATLAGAEILRCHRRCGNLQKGKEANFIVTPLPKNCVKKIDQLSAEEVLKQLHTKVTKRDDYDQLVQATYYQGRQIFVR